MTNHILMLSKNASTIDRVESVSVTWTKKNTLLELEYLFYMSSTGLLSTSWTVQKQHSLADRTLWQIDTYPQVRSSTDR